MRFGAGQALEFAAGADIPETSISVVTGAGQRVTRAQLGGQKLGLVVTQRLWRLLDGELAGGTPCSTAGCPGNLSAPLPLL